MSPLAETGECYSSKNLLPKLGEQEKESWQGTHSEEYSFGIPMLGRPDFPGRELTNCHVQSRLILLRRQTDGNLLWL